MERVFECRCFKANRQIDSVNPRDGMGQRGRASLGVTVVAKLLLGGGRTASGLNQTNSKPQYFAAAAAAVWTGNVEEVTR